MPSKKKAKSNGAPKSTRLSPEDFVKAWQKADNLDEFEKATGMGPIAASNRARHYRKIGVELKAYPRRSSARIDVKALNALVK